MCVPPLSPELAVLLGALAGLLFGLTTPRPSPGWRSRLAAVTWALSRRLARWWWNAVAPGAGRSVK